MINLKKTYCTVFGHKILKLSEEYRRCKKCGYSEKRLKLGYNYTKHTMSYSDWKSSEFIDNMAKDGDKVRLKTEEPGSSYWVVMESSIYKIRFMHPSTYETFEILQDPTLYEIL